MLINICFAVEHIFSLANVFSATWGFARTHVNVASTRMLLKQHNIHFFNEIAVDFDYLKFPF